MNHIYRTVWNEVTRAFSAAAETARGKGKSSSSKRSADASAAALAAGGLMMSGCGTAAPPGRRRLAGLGARPLALEQRFMFDGAAATEVFHAIDGGAEAANGFSEKAGAAVKSAAADGLAPPAIDAARADAPAALRLAEANPAANRGRTEIIFIEDNVADYGALAAAAKPGAEVVLLDSRADGLEQMARHLAGRAGVDAIHLFSHGAEAQLDLGAVTLTADNLGRHGAALDGIGRALAEDGDFLLYGCDAAGGGKGLDFIGKIAAATGADVAASIDPTGAAARDGDWNLEVRTGGIETAGERPLAYSGLLATGQAGQVDTAFGTEAKAGVTAPDYVYAGETYVYQSGANAGKVLTAASSVGLAIVSRFNADGSADTSFNTTGSASFSFHSNSWGSFISVDGNGKIVVVGSDTDSATNTTFGVARLNDDGSFDTSFNGNGKAFLDLDADISSGGSNAVMGMSIQSDNKIVVTGGSFNDKSVVARITTTGVLDTTFSGDGLVLTDFNTAGLGVERFFGVVASGDSIYAVGGDSAILKVVKIKQSDGSLDTTFGTGGIYSLDTGGYSDGGAPIIQADGKIVISCASQYGGASEKSATLFRLTTGGALDTTFGTNGFFIQHIGSTGLSDGQIIATQLSDGKIALSAKNNNDGIEVLRLTGAGLIDTGFGASGTKHIAFPHTRLMTGFGVSLAGNANGDLFVFGTDMQGAAATTSGALLKLFGAQQTGAMTYSFATTMQYSGPISREYTRDVIGVVVATNGEASPFGASSFSFNLNGTTTLADIANAKLYYTGENAWLDTSTQIGSTVTGVNGTFTFVGAQSLTTEFNVFWLAAKTASGAAPDNTVDGQLTALTVNNVARTPVLADPYGSKRIFDQLAARVIWNDDMNSSETRTIKSDGNDFLTIIPNSSQYFSGIALDVANDKMYLSRSDGKLLIANLDGSAKHVIADIGLTPNELVPKGIAVAPDYLGSGRIFYGTILAGNHAIVRANLDGSGATTIVSGLGALVQTMEIDTIHNKLYWIESESSGDGNGSLKMANLDGSGVQTLRTFSGAEMVTALALDAANDKLYYASRAATAIYQSDLNGANQSMLADFSATGVNAPFEMAIDAAAGKLYWTDANNYKLFETSLATPATPTAFTVIDSNGYEGAAGQGIVFKPANLAPLDPPALTGATYDVATGLLSVTGSDMTTGDTIDLSKLTVLGEGGATRTLSTASVTASGATTFSATLNAADRAALALIMNKNGTSSTSGTTFNLAAADDWDGNVTAGNTADATNAVTVSNVAAPTITGATYDAATGVLSVTGAGLLSKSGATNDIDVSKLALTGQDGGSYSLTTAGLELTDGTTFSLTLNATDKFNVNGLLNKNGTSAVGGTTFNLAAAEDWAAGADSAVVVADTTGNGVTVSNVAAPAISSAAYNASSGVLTLAGTNLVALPGAANDLSASALTLTGEGGASYTLTTGAVDVASASSATITLNGTDRAAVNQFLNKNGTSSTGGASFNLAAADDWNTVVANADIADAVNTLTVSGVAAPAIASATYDAASGVLTVTGSGFLALSGAANDIDVSKLTLLGEGGATRALTSAAVDIASGTGFSVTLNPADQAALALFMNKNGTSSTGGTTFNLAAAEDWAAGADAAASLADPTNALTVGDVPTPTISSATYDAATGVLSVTGTGFLSKTGGANDIDVSKLTLTGEGGASYSLTGAGADISSATSFSVTLSAADKFNANGLLNQDGVSAVGGTTFNLAAAEDWAAGADAAVTVADITGNGVIVANVSAPSITSAAYNASSGVLTLTGSNLVALPGAANDITASALTLSGEGGASYTLTTNSADATSATTASITLNATDKAAVNQFLNKNGTVSTGGTSFNLAAADDWNSVVANANIADTLNTLTLSGVAAPAIGSASYDATTGVLTVAGSGFLTLSGATNDIDVSKLTLLGEGGATHTLTSAAVEIASGTGFSVTLNAADQQAVALFLNKNGSSSTSGTTFNLAAAEDWAAGADAAATVVDASNIVIVSNVAAPTVTSATYDAATGVLSVTGTGLLSKSGATNDIDVSKLTLSGQSGGSYTLTSGSVELTDGGTFALALNAADKFHVNGLLNKNGSSAVGGTTYNLAAAEDWAAGANALVVVSDPTGNGVTVSNVSAPAITGATYDAASGVLTLSGTNLVALPGATNDLSASALTLSGEAGASYTLTTGAVEISSASSASITLNGTDKAAVNQFLNKNGTVSTGGASFNLAAADDWNSVVANADIADAVNTLTVSGVAAPAIASAAYNAGSGVLTVTGSGFLTLSGAANDIDLSKLTLLGEGGASRALTSAAVDIASGTGFSVTLNPADQAALALFMNQNGTSSTGGTAFNLAAAEDWAAGADAVASVADATSAVTVSGVAAPTITGAAYDSMTGVLTVTGSGFLSKAGAANDIDVTKLQVAGDSAYTLTADSANVELDGGTGFTVTLGAIDKAAVDAILSKDGLSSPLSATYNLAALEDWAAGADAAVNLADPSGNGIAVTGHNATPVITDLDGTSVAWAGAGNIVTLDGGAAATVSDLELGALNGGGGSWSGATLTIGRVTAAGAADGSSRDRITFLDSTLFDLQVGNAHGAYPTQSIDAAFAAGQNATGALNDSNATGWFARWNYTYATGTLTIEFGAASGDGDFNATATSALVQDVIRHIGYRSDTSYGDATIRFALGDGTSTRNADVAVTSNIITVDRTDDADADGDAADGFTLREALARGAAQAGLDTIVLDGIASGTTLTLGGAATLGAGDTLSYSRAGGNSLSVAASAGTLALGAGATFAAGTGDSLTVSADLSGTSLNKTGAGTLTLSGNNSYTGATTVAAGTLSVASDSNLGSGALTLAGGATLAVTGATTIDNAVALSGAATIKADAAVTLSGALSGGALHLTKTGADTLTLSNTGNAAGLTGGVTVSAGTLAIAGATSLVGGSVTLDGGTLALPGATTVANAIALGAGGGTLSNIAGSNTVSGVISGAGALTAAGTGTLTLSGSNTYSGGTTINTAAWLELSNAAALGAGAVTFTNGNLSITDNYTIANALVLNKSSATIDVASGKTLTWSGAISEIGGARALNQTGSGGTIVLSGSNTYTGATTVSTGTLALSGGASIADTSAVTLAAGATLSLTGGGETIGSLAGAGNVALGTYRLTAGGDNTSTTFSGVISGNLSGLTKQGSGTLTLSGANTYTGSTTISAGTLSVGGSGIADASGVTVAAGATLTLTGSETIGSLAGAGNATLGANTLNTGGNNTSTSFSGVMSGGGGLTKAGSGTFTLSGANSYTGATTVSAGTLSVGGGSVADASAVSVAGTLLLSGDEAVGSLAGAGSVTLAGHTLTTGANNSSTAFSGAVQGAGALVKAGGGTLTLSGANSGAAFDTGVTGGALSVAGDANLGAGTLTLNGGALQVTSSATIDNAVALAGAGEIVATAATTLSGVVSGSGALTKSGSATLTLGGGNTYSGTTTVSNGTLSVAGDANLGGGALTLAAGTTLQVTGATSIDNAVALSGAAAIENAAVVTLSGALSGGAQTLTKSGAGTLTLTNTGNEAGLTGGITVLAGTLAASTDNALAAGTITLSDATLDVSGATVIDNAFTFDGDGATINNADALTLSGAIGGAGGLVKTGAGKLTTSGADGHGGATAVNAGTLAVNGAMSGPGAVSVAAGATLAGSGSVAGAVTVANGAFVAPGNSPGTLTLDGGLLLAPGATLTLEIDGTAAGSGYDQLDVTGTVTLSSAKIAPTLGYAPTLNDTFVVIDNDGADAIVGSLKNAAGDVIAEGETVLAGGYALQVSYVGGDGNDLTLTAFNQAPVLDDALAPALPAIVEDVADAANGGASVASLVDGAISDTGDTAPAIAVTAVDDSNGTWQYSLDNGASWSAFGAASEASARLLDGSPTGAATQKIRFVPNPEYNGSALITFRAWDMSNGAAAGDTGDASTTGGGSAYSSASDTAAVSVTPVNDPPLLATPAAISLTDNAAADAFAARTGALHATDSDSGALAYGIQGGAVAGGFSTRAGGYGTLSVNTASGAYTYTPNAAAVNALAANATDSFTVTVSDGGTPVAANFTVNLAGVNDTPLLAAPSGAAYADTAAADAFANTSGTLAGTDRDAGAMLTYGVQGGSVAAGRSTLAGAHGTLSVDTASGAYTYTPDAAAINALGANATDSFTVTVRDNAGATTSAVYSVSLTAANDTPTLAAPAAAGYADTAAADSFADTSGTLAGADRDAGAVLTYGVQGGSVVAGRSTLAGAHGTLSVDTASGAYTYSPDAAAINALGANTSDSFTVTVRDAAGATTSALYTVNLTAANDAPTLAAPNGAAYADTAANDSFANTAGTLLGADRDAGATLTYGVEGGAAAGGVSSRAGAYGTLSVNSTTGAYTYAPNAAAINALTANTSDSFTVTVRDNAGATTSAVYSVSLTAANDTPTLAAPAAAGYADTAAADAFANTSGTLAGTDRDAGAALTYGVQGGSVAAGRSTLAGAHGTLSVDTASGAYTYAPNAAAINALTANTSDSFTVTVRDAAGASASASAHYTVNLTAANDAPTLAAPNGAAYADTAANDSFANAAGTLLGVDRDAGATLTYGVDGAAAAGGLSSRAGAYGTLSVNSATGAYTYAPNAAAINALGANATDSFTVTARDNAGATTSAVYSVSLTAANDAPTLAAPAAPGYADTAATDSFADTSGTLAGTDRDAGAVLTYGVQGGSVAAGRSTLAGAHGTLSVDSASGAYTYTPDAAAINALTANTSDSFTVTVRDAAGASASALYTVNLTAANDAPALGTPSGVAYADTAAADHFGVAAGTLAGSDADGGATAAYGIQGGVVAGGASSRAGAYGTLSVDSASGAYTYAPNDAAINALGAGASASDVFTVTLRDAGGATATASYTVSLSGANDAPTLAAPAAAGYADTAAADSFADTSGTLAGADREAGAALTYGVQGGSVAAGRSTLAGAHGTLSVDSASGAYTYTPDAAAINALGANASDSFTVTVRDAAGATTSAIYSVSLTAANDAPTLAAPTGAAYADTAANDSFANAAGTLLGADRDAGAVLTYGVDGGTAAGGLSSRAGAYGTLSVDSASGAYTYTPNDAAINALGAGASASDVFTVTLRDAGGATATASYTVSLSGANDAPTLSAASAGYADTAAVDAFGALSGNLAGADRDSGAALAYAIVGGASAGGRGTLAGAYGTLALDSASGAFIYTPNGAAINALKAGVNASDSFTLTLGDGANSASATFTVNLAGANDAPTLATTLTEAAYADTAAHDNFGPLDGTLSGADGEGDAVSFGIAGQGADASRAGFTHSKAGAYGTLYLNSASGAYQFVPAAAAIEALGGAASETFRLLASDAAGASAGQDLTIRLTGANDAPAVAKAPPPQSASGGAPFSLSVAGTFADADAGEALAYAATLADGSALPAWLRFDAATQTFSGTPADADAGVLKVAVTAADRGGASAASGFELVVARANSAPQGGVTLSGAMIEGQTLNAHENLRDDDGMGTLGYRWQASGDGAGWTDLPGATGPSLTLGAAQAGLFVRVVASYTDDAGHAEVVASDNGGARIALAPPRPETPPPNPAPSAPAPAAPVAPIAPPAPPAPTPATIPFIGSDALKAATDGAPQGQEPSGAIPSPGGDRGQNASPGNGEPSTRTQVGVQGAGFPVLVAGANSGVDGLTIARGIPDQVLDTGARAVIAIPIDAFAHSDANAVVTLSARQSDGQALPNWVKFNAASGKFEVTAPPGVSGDIVIKVTARDAQGKEATTIFKLKVGAPRQATLERAGRPGLSQQIRLAAQRPAGFERLAAPATPGGHGPRG